MSAVRGIIGTFMAEFLCHFMPSCSKGLSGTYMWSDMTEYLVVSEQLHIIHSRRYSLKFDVPGQYKC